MTLETAIACTIIFILCGVAMGFFLGPNRGRWFGAWIGLCASGAIAFWSWVAFVAFHFISKYW